VKSVTVGENVQLEVLDWGGSSPAIVLLAGLGSTAHHFDDLAPALTARYRVVGVTRRGHPGSSAPTTGYGFTRLAEDVVRVIDAVGVRRPVVIGHSFAGEEMHVLGARYSDKIRAWFMPMRHSIVETTRTPRRMTRWRERVEKLYTLTRERFRNHAKWFEAFADGGRVAELSGNHDLIVSNPREVLRKIEEFVSSIAEKP
jgi:hypothetical protein